MTGRVLLLSPSCGLGGGIERYVAGLEWALAAEGVACQRLDLDGFGPRAHARLLNRARGTLRAVQEPARIVVAHATLMPLAMVLARDSSACGISVICHGAEVWGPRWHVRRSLERRLMCRSDVRAIAVSSFTAGTLPRGCQATVLHPGLSPRWSNRLVDAASARQDGGSGIRLATAFRLADWRDKGLPQLVAAVQTLDRPDVALTVYGSGEPPLSLLRLAARHSWCDVKPGLCDEDLAAEFAAADLFILATRTRMGRRACGEGFGLVLLEAQAAGTPVLAPAHGGSQDAFVEGVTGVAPPSESAEALADTLEELLKDPDRLAWMGLQAARWARDVSAPERYRQLVLRRLL